jgi:cytochrome b
MLIAGVLLAYLASEEESWLTWHTAFGYMVGALLLFRIGWGMLDIPYSRFGDFTFNLNALKSYLSNVLGDKTDYTGHNPASSYAVIAMMILGLLTVLSGMLLYGIQEGMGIFAPLNLTRFKQMAFAENLHELLTNLFLLVIFVHICGVLIDYFVHHTDTLRSMLDGYKRTDAPSIQLTLGQKLYGAAWITIPLLLVAYTLASPSTLLTRSIHTPLSYEKDHPLFHNECSACHILYPPHLLPSRSWQKMMTTLQDHFGDDASLEDEDTQAITDYLLKHSAETSTQEAAWRISQSIQKQDIIAITKTPYWEKRHRVIDKETFRQKGIGKPSNCKACHGSFESGLLHDRDIAIPKARP